jgi:hypothetical protein
MLIYYLSCLNCCNQKRNIFPLLLILSVFQIAHFVSALPVISKRHINSGDVSKWREIFGRKKIVSRRFAQKRALSFMHRNMPEKSHVHILSRARLTLRTFSIWLTRLELGWNGRASVREGN